VKKILTLLFITLISTEIFSQNQVIYDKTENKTFTVSSQNADAWLNQILQTLARAYGKPTSAVRFQFAFEQNNQISTRGNQLNFFASIKKIKITGDCKYKHFGLEDLLVPEKLDFELKWLKGNQILGNYTLRNVKINSGETEILNKTITDTLHGTNYSISLENYVFNYTGNNVNELNDKVNQIDTYHSQLEIVSRKITEITQINSEPEDLRRMPNLDKIYDYKNIATSNLDLIRNTENQGFYKNLVQKGEDPSEFSKKIEQLEHKSRKLLTNSEDVLSHLDEIYYNRGMEMLSRNNPGGADQMFNVSIQKNPNFAPSHFQLARLYYNGGNVGRAIDKIFEIRRMNPDPQTKQQTIEFADGIYKDFILQANDLNNRGMFDRAMAVLADAKKLCTDFPEVRCLANMDNEYSRAVNGKYDIILHDFDASFKANKLVDAEKIINVAKNYRESNMMFLPDDGDIVDRLNDLYFKYISLAESENKQLLYDKAMSHLIEAQRICTSYREMTCSPELDTQYLIANTGIYQRKLNESEKKFREANYDASENALNDAMAYRLKYGVNPDNREQEMQIAIKQKIHDKLIADALKLEQNKNFESALQKYKDARNLENQFSISPNKFLEKYINGSAKSLIIQKIAEGESAVAINDLTKARNSYSRAQLLQGEYPLADDREINKALGTLKDKIFKQECINAQTEYDKIIAGALSFEAVKDYISADNTINEALKYSSDFPYCGINIKPALDKKHEIEDAVTYSKKMNTLFNSIKNSDFQTAINLYIDASEFYKSKNIVRYGTQHDDLYSFILKQNSNFINFTAGWYMDKKEFDKVQELFKVLKTRNFDKSYTENNQKKFAALMAQKDYSENPAAEYKSNITKYFGDDKFFKAFGKEYKKQWKRLK